MTVEEFKKLVRDRCYEQDTKVGKTKGDRLFKQNNNDKILNLIFKEIRWYIPYIINGKELVDTFVPEELLKAGFLTQENNPIDFSKTVNIRGVNWYNENEPCGIIEDENDIIVYKDVKLTKKEFCKRCDEKVFCKGRKSNCIYGIDDIDDDDDFFTEDILTLNFNLPKTKRLPNENELRSLCNLEQQLGYYNGCLCKVFEKKLVFPVYEGTYKYLSAIDKKTERYCCIFLKPTHSYIGDGYYSDILIRCVKTNSKLIQSDNSNNIDNTPDKVDLELKEKKFKNKNDHDRFPPIRDSNRNKNYNRNTQGCLSVFVVFLCMFFIFLILI